jgi:putative addiction module killer protein
MLELRQTDIFRKWRTRLKDARGLALIASRLDRLAFFGHAGDAKAVGEGISELRIDYGPGYRIYSSDAADYWSSCYVAATKALRRKT